MPVDQHLHCFHILAIVSGAPMNIGVHFSLVYFLAVLGLRCCAWAFSSCGEQGLLFVVVCGFLIAVASLAEHGL